MRQLLILLSTSLIALALPAHAQEPTKATLAVNQAMKNSLPFEDKTDFENARRGLIATLDADQITAPDGRVIYDIAQYEFIQGEAPDTANPSLWRQGELTAIHGLFEVVKGGIYQIRGFDLAVMSFIRGDTGWIVIDPLTARQTSEAGLKLLRDKVEDLPVSAVIITHSHVDHFGGVEGVLTEEDIESRNIQLIAPKGFFEEAISENLIAGNAMGRRASYMYGNLLEKSPTGTLGSGLGTTTAAGTTSIMKPTVIISETPTEYTIDGVDMTFLYTPGAEAPAEMMFYIPKFKAMMQAEEISHTLHNLYTLRGAKVRSGDLWAKYIHETINRFGDDVQVSFGSHHWPTWGNEEINTYWKGQRDTYRYIHDEVLRLANGGATMLEVAEQIELPESLSGQFSNRDYYGSVSHNAKAQYQLYFGWFSGNPADLDALPPVEEGKKFVEYAGGAEAVLKKAKADFDAGNYRWASTALSHLVFAQPDNQAARDMLADSFTQQGYQSENGTWRNFFLTGAKELRNGVGKSATPGMDSEGIIRALPLEDYLDYLAVLLNHPEAVGQEISLNFVLPDVDETFFLTISNGVLNYTVDTQSKEADATVTVDRALLDDINTGHSSFEDALADGSINIKGDQDKFVAFISLLGGFEFWFNVVTP